MTAHAFAPPEVERAAPARGSAQRDPHALLALQRAAGNAAVSARLADMKSMGDQAPGGPDEIVDAKSTAPGPPGPAVLEVARKKKKKNTSAGVTVTVPAHVKAPSSPAGMPDRIPPRVNTAVHVDVAGAGPDDVVELEIEGGGGGNGTVTIDGAATKDINASADVNLQGGTQTDAGKAGNLKLVAFHYKAKGGLGNWIRRKRGKTLDLHKGNRVGQTPGFSVSAIPQNYTDTFVSLVTGDRRGFVVQDGWESDSGTFGDLDQTQIAEQVEVTSSTGCFTGTSKRNSGYLAGNKLSKDTHGAPVSLLTKAGNRVATQTCMFKDLRSRANDIPMTNSGYTLVRDVRAKDEGGGFVIQTTKNGAAVTANGVASGAGVGSIDKTQDV